MSNGNLKMENGEECGTQSLDGRDGLDLAVTSDLAMILQSIDSFTNSNSKLKQPPFNLSTLSR